MSKSWLSVEQFASIRGITVQAARKQIRKALHDPSPGISVRQTKSRGGRSGIRYEVALTRLSEAPETGKDGLSERAAGEVVPAALATQPRIPASNQGARIAARWEIIGEAAMLAPRSRERAVALQNAAQRSGHSLRSLQRWLRELEDCGGDVNSLARRRPANAGTRRIWVSRRFDSSFRAAGYAGEVLESIAESVDQFCRTVWASPRQRSGWRWVCRDVVTMLKAECRDRNIRLPSRAFHLSKRRIMEAEHFRRVDIYLNDRKRFDDQKPRIRRDNSKLAPMQQIVMDVKPIDIIMRRPDGSEVCPKMIAFMDAGTHRIFPYFYLAPKGEGVRQEHVTAAFLEMVSDPEWGFPQQLYRDNGTEFYHFDKIRDALALVQVPGQPTIINARPYSGASKPIESKFGVLDKYVFSQFEGYIGGNRLNKKTQTVGRPVEPYPGDLKQFIGEATSRIADFHSVALLTGPFAGRSPFEIYADHVRSGWRPVRVHEAALDAAFCDRTTRRVDRGAVSIDGTRYRHPELVSLNGRAVRISLSWRRGASPLAELPELGWVYLEPEMLHLPGDIAGAIESGRMQKRELRVISELRRQAKPARKIDPLAERVAALPSRAAPAPIIDLLMSNEAESIAAAREAGDKRVAALPAPEERRRARRMAETAELEAYLAQRRA